MNPNSISYHVAMLKDIDTLPVDEIYIYLFKQQVSSNDASTLVGIIRSLLNYGGSRSKEIELELKDSGEMIEEILRYHKHTLSMEQLLKTP